MKRGGPLRRRTELGRKGWGIRVGGPDRRGPLDPGQLRRSKPMKRGGPLPPVNPERRARDREVQDGPQSALARVMPCCSCGAQPSPDGQSDPDHVTTRGARGTDADAVPLCRECHIRRHTIGVLTFWREVEARTGRGVDVVLSDMRARVARGDRPEDYCA